MSEWPGPRGAEFMRTWCDECERYVTGESMVDASHGEACSLHPANGEGDES